jgi:hypothetical protein
MLLQMYWSANDWMMETANASGHRPQTRSNSSIRNYLTPIAFDHSLDMDICGSPPAGAIVAFHDSIHSL